jgi:hypothetical protein
MSHPYHHALSSVKKWGGEVEDYIKIHNWFDESKSMWADFRHRALRHHAEGIFMCETIFGSTITLSNGKSIPTRWVGEQHVKEDLGRIPSIQDWFSAITPQKWMGQTKKLEEELDDRPKKKHEDILVTYLKQIGLYTGEDVDNTKKTDTVVTP